MIGRTRGLYVVRPCVFLNLIHTREGEGEVVELYGCVWMFWDMNVLARLHLCRIADRPTFKSRILSRTSDKRREKFNL